MSSWRIFCSFESFVSGGRLGKPLLFEDGGNGFGSPLGRPGISRMPMGGMGGVMLPLLGGRSIGGFSSVRNEAGSVVGFLSLPSFLVASATLVSLGVIHCCAAGSSLASAGFFSLLA